MNVELLLIGFVILMQLIFFFVTWGNIASLGAMFPFAHQLRLKDLSISEQDANLLTKDELQEKIQQSNDYIITEDSEESHPLLLDLIDIDVIDSNNNFTTTFQKVLKSTNTYLVRNKNHAADFKIIREIAEREVEAKENQINATINLPLYLGLLGTILGIVFGLWDISQLDNIEDSIPRLLSGVSVAMVASFVGLFLTIIANGLLYKSAINKCDTKKNDYLTFIQTELLPILSKDMTSSMITLQSNINSFNEGFKQNIASFSSTIGKVQENIRMQKQFIERLDEMDYDRMLKANAYMFDKFNKSAQHFDNFIDYQDKLNGTIQSSRLAIEQLYSLVMRFKDFEDNTNDVATYLKNTFSDHNKTLEYIESNLGEIKVREVEMRGLIAELDNTFKKSVTIIQEGAERELKSFRAVVSDELNIIQKSYEQGRPKFQHLEKLTEINETLLKLKEQNENSTEAKSIPIEVDNGKVIAKLDELNENFQ